MKILLDKNDIKRSLTRITHEILEKNSDLDNLVLVGIKTRGEYLMKRIASNIKNIVLDNKTVYMGEIGLTGQIRSVSNIEKRIKEISKMGFKKVVINKKQAESVSKNKEICSIIEVVGINSLEEAFNF